MNFLTCPKRGGYTKGRKNGFRPSLVRIKIWELDSLCKTTHYRLLLSMCHVCHVDQSYKANHKISLISDGVFTMKTDFPILSM